jgi:hypothetical protein
MKIFSTKMMKIRYLSKTMSLMNNPISQMISKISTRLYKTIRKISMKTIKNWMATMKMMKMPRILQMMQMMLIKTTKKAFRRIKR